MTSGRTALIKALQRLGVDSRCAVLVPAFHCTAMIDPVSWLGARSVYYRLKPDLSVDWDDVRLKMGDDVRVMLVVHYFGFPQCLDEITEFCNARGIGLIEDCAHAMFGEYKGQALGSFGDYAIASSMKFYPAYDGGCLVSARNVIEDDLDRAGFTFELKSVLNTLERSVGFGHMTPFNTILRWLLKAKDYLWKYRQLVDKDSEQKGVGPDSAYGGYELDPAWNNVGMSRASSLLLRFVSSDRIIYKRRRNYLQILEAVRSLSGCRPLVPELPDGVVPYVFPLIVNDQSRVFDSLKKRGVPIYRWEKLYDEQCSVSTEYSKKLFQLACHQELSKDELRWMLVQIKEALEEC